MAMSRQDIVQGDWVFAKDWDEAITLAKPNTENRVGVVIPTHGKVWQYQVLYVQCVGRDFLI